MILEHIYCSRPPSARAVLTALKGHPLPHPRLLYLPELHITVISTVYASLLFLCPHSTDVQPLAILEFIHRVIEVFEDFLGSPLLPSKIEENYDVVAQLLGEMCDGGVICNTETNALREVVEIPGLIGKFFTQVGLPGYSLTSWYVSCSLY